MSVRRVGNMYYTHEFAEAFFKVMLQSKASFRDIAAKFIMQSQTNNNALTSMLPPSNNNSFWSNVAEDIMTSKEVRDLLRRLLRARLKAAALAHLGCHASWACAITGR